MSKMNPCRHAHAPKALKKTLFFLIICLAFQLKTQAQHVFAPIGAEWWYGGDIYDCANPLAGQPQPDFWTDHVKATRDTVINGTSCTVLEASRIKSANGNIDTVLIQPFYMYDNTDTVFVYNDSIHGFTPLYIFNAHVGDTITYNQSTPPFSFIVDSIAYLHVNNDSLKTIYTHTRDTAAGPRPGFNWGCHGYSSGGLRAGSYTQKIGMHDATISGFFPIFTVPLADGAAFGTFPMGKLRCYSDTSISLVYGSTACDSVLAVPLSVHNIKGLGNQVSVAPNPAFSEINIASKTTFQAGTVIRIYDILGHEIMLPASLNQKQNVTIDVRSWPAGMYILHLIMNGSNYYEKLIVQH